MVMSEPRETNRNGKRSRGTSPSANNNNTNSKAQNITPPEDLTPETSDDDNHSKKNLGKPKNGKSEFEEKIRVGKDYQVIVPEKLAQRQETYPDKALLVWSPAREIPDSKLEEYISLAKERYGYNAEQALGMLFWHKHDLEKAVTDLANFTPFPDEWSKEDKVLFEQAFMFHGKCFHRIRQMLPDKSIASLVKFYYSWKKTRTRSSAIERQEKKKAGRSENGSENNSPEDSNEDEKDMKQYEITEVFQKVQPSGCENCGASGDKLVHEFCMGCFNHYSRTGLLLPSQAPVQEDSNSFGYKNLFCRKFTRKVPAGMYLNSDDIVKLAEREETVKKNPKKRNSHEDVFMTQMNRQIDLLSTDVQKNKQKIEVIKSENTKSLHPITYEEKSRTILQRKWSKDECLLAQIGRRKFGDNFKAIADVIGTKTEYEIQKFFKKWKECDKSLSITQKFENLQNDSSVVMIKSIKIDSDEDAQQVKDAEMIGNIDEIIGVKTPGKTSIMTTSAGKTLKRKHEDDAVKADDEVSLIADDAMPEKKLAMETLETKSEITITAIPKKSDNKESEVATISVA